MKLIYNNKEISVTNTKNDKIMRFKYQKLYYAIIIDKCNRYSSIGSKQRIDIALVDDNLQIKSFKYDMHENTVYEDKVASKTIILPPNTFTDLEVNKHFTIKE